MKDLTIITFTNTDETVFSKEFDTDKIKTDDWLVVGNRAGILSSTCGKYNLFGGYNTFGYKTTASKVFSGLPKHTFLKVSFTLFFVDSWDWESLFISVDDEIVRAVKKTDVYGGNYHMCGWTATMEEVILVEALVPHSNDKFTFQLKD